MLQLIAAVALAAPVRAQGTSLNVLPATVTIPNVGDTAIVDVYVNDTNLLYGYEIKLWFIQSIVNTTSADVVRPVGNLMEPADPANQFVAKWTVDYTNTTYGMIWVGFSLLFPEFPRNGTGLLFEINFTGVSVGETPIFIDYPGETNPAILSDNEAQPIPCTATDGNIVVIPEFPMFLLLPILAITSVAVASFARLYRRKRL